MTDSDGDGVVNVDDIDDDNDGIIDYTEQGTCNYPENSLEDFTYTGNGSVSTAVATSGGGYTITTTGNNGSWQTKYSDQSFKLPIHLEWTTNTTGIAMFGLLPVGNTKTIANYNDAAYKIYHNGSTIYGYMPTAWNFNKTYVSGTKMEIDISATGIVVVKQNGLIVRTFKGVVSDYNLAISPYSTNKVLNNVKLTSYANNGYCDDADTDGDGMVVKMQLKVELRFPMQP